MVESIGKRIALLRQKNGWTQASFASRLAMSRVAISHIEMDLSIPSERSITLMAGIFKLSPLELVEHTTYPKAKMERLPELNAIYTELELQYLLLLNDMEWLRKIDDTVTKNINLKQLLDKWLPWMDSWDHQYSEQQERQILSKIRQILDDLRIMLNHPLA